jgi:hypothetical protein
MPPVVCGHFNFIVRDKWILCQDCDLRFPAALRYRGIDANGSLGKRILNRGKKRLNPLAQSAYDAMVESYRELVERAGTTDPEVLADVANGRLPNT